MFYALWDHDQGHCMIATEDAGSNCVKWSSIKHSKWSIKVEVQPDSVATPASLLTRKNHPVQVPVWALLSLLVYHCNHVMSNSDYKHNCMDHQFRPWTNCPLSFLDKLSRNETENKRVQETVTSLFPFYPILIWLGYAQCCLRGHDGRTGDA